jgi:hypothetical protein
LDGKKLVSKHDEATQLKKYLHISIISIPVKLHLSNQITDYLYDISSIAPGYYFIGIIGIQINSAITTSLVYFDRVSNNEIKIRVYNSGPNITPDSIIVKLLYSKYTPTM